MACLTPNTRRRASIYPKLEKWIDNHSLTYAEFSDKVALNPNSFSKFMFGELGAKFTVITNICSLTGLLYVVSKDGCQFIEPSEIEFDDIPQRDDKYYRQPVLAQWLEDKDMSPSTFSETYNISSFSLSCALSDGYEKVTNTMIDICKTTGLYYVVDSKSKMYLRRKGEPVKPVEPVDDIPTDVKIEQVNNRYDVETYIEYAVDNILVSIEKYCSGMKSYSLNDYQIDAARTIRNLNKYHDTVHHSLFGMAAEIGELQSIHQKLYQGHLFEAEHAKEELGDILWMIAEYASANNWTLEDVARSNIRKLQKRYPDGFSVDKSLNRPEGGN